MKRTGIKMGLMVMVLVMMLSMLPLASASAGFVPDEEPVRVQVSTAAANRAVALQTSQASYPFPMKGGYVVYPGRAWNLRFMLPKDGCFRLEGHDFVDYKGNPCIP